MSYIALYREWRPSVFEDVVEQEHVVKTLRHSISAGRIAHAYLFCGTRGTGKTTMAHILSRAINCLNPVNGDPCNKCDICREILSGSSTDVLEIDAASNNSVDNVREIRDEVIYAPSKAKYKVYIIDEVHMLSSGAFNALLKTLEEPPAHAVFILATTEPYKLPATILSRCQRFDFRRITNESIVGRLNTIAAANSVTLEEDAARLIAKMSDGALRDAISLLDQCISVGSQNITYNEVLSVIGIVNDTFMSSVADYILDRDTGKVLYSVEQLVMDGKDITHFISDLVLYFRNLLICKISSSPAEIINVPQDTIQEMKRQCAKSSRDEIINIIRELSALESSLKWAVNPRIMLEVTLVKLCSILPAEDGSILDRLTALENALKNGTIIKGSSSAAARQDTGSGIYSGAAAGSQSVSQPAGMSLSDKAPVQSKAGDTGKQKSSPKEPPKYEYLDYWDEVLNLLKSSGRMKLYTYLYGTKAVSLGDGSIGIVFESSNTFSKAIVSKSENLEVLEEAVTKLKGHAMHVRCIDEDNLPQYAVKKTETEKDELVEKARNLAEAAGVPFNIIDE